jgi:TPP-dependent trihydroxycyclohexane-1,2-dione (THcHDO) dehydratase
LRGNASLRTVIATTLAETMAKQIKRVFEELLSAGLSCICLPQDAIFWNYDFNSKFLNIKVLKSESVYSSTGLHELSS